MAAKTAKLPRARATQALPPAKQTVTGSNGNGRKPAPKTAPEVSADVVQLALRSRFNPIRNLTPQLLATYIDQFFLGFIAYAALAWEWIERRDDVLKNVAAKRKKDVARLDWEILPIDGADQGEAQAHVDALNDFYNNLTAVNALDENERGGFPLLIRQMMDAVGKYYAVHEIIWKPGELSATGDDMLTAEFRFVPLWFFENRTGKLRFMKLPLGSVDGDELEDGGWMVTKGEGLMEACSIAYMFKNMPLKDWVAYSDKFGTPGILGITNAAKESDAYKAMVSAVTNFGQSWSGVVSGADGAIKDPIQLIQAKGEGVLPFPPLIERMDRAMASLWRGSDLSTISGSKEHNVGASVQESESNILLYDDSAIISETLNHYVDRWVIWQKFGTDRPLAYVKILAPEDEDLQLRLKVLEMMLNSGARIGERDQLEYFGIQLCADDDVPLHAPAHITERISEQAQVTGEAGAAQTATLGEPGAQGQPQPKKTVSIRAPATIQLPNIRMVPADVDLERFLDEHRDHFLKAFANDLHPLRRAMEAALQGGDGVEDGRPDLKNRLIILRAQLPHILKQIGESDKTPKALANIMAAALIKGISQESRNA